MTGVICMRKALAIGTALVFSFAAPAAAASPMTGVGDAHGTGAGKTSPLGFVHFELSAHERPTGDFGQVSVRTTTGDLSFKIEVTCVNLNALQPTGGAGFIQGVVTQASPVSNVAGIAVGHRHLIAITDGGEPSSIAPVDSFYDIIPDPFAPNTCKLMPFTATVPNVEQGNVNIKLG
jgi:hypothetical protein